MCLRRPFECSIRGIFCFAGGSVFDRFVLYIHTSSKIHGFLTLPFWFNLIIHHLVFIQTKFNECKLYVVQVGYWAHTTQEYLFSFSLEIYVMFNNINLFLIFPNYNKDFRNNCVILIFYYTEYIRVQYLYLFCYKVDSCKIKPIKLTYGNCSNCTVHHLNKTSILNISVHKGRYVSYYVLELFQCKEL